MSNSSEIKDRGKEHLPKLEAIESKDLLPHRLARSIAQLDNPESVITTLPAQTVYLAIAHEGLEGAIDLLSYSSPEQVRHFLDFDVWKRDRLDEARLFEWLSITDSSGDLELLQKIFKVLDLKLVALLISKYLDVQVYEEPTEAPPSPHHTTPDNGRTWVEIRTEDSNHHFLLGRLLALVYETSPELWYQLIGASSLNTPAVLEEESFIDRQRRLFAEGVPEPEVAFSLHTPLATEELRAIATAAKAEHSSPSLRPGFDLAPIEPFTHQECPSPLQELVTRVRSEQFASELTHLCNCAIVRFSVDFSDSEIVALTLRKVIGAINIGVELLGSVEPAEAIVRARGCTPLYQAGMTHIIDTATRVRNSLRARAGTPEMEIVVEKLSLPFPEIPTSLTSETTPGQLNPSSKPIEHLHELAVLQTLLQPPLLP